MRTSTILTPAAASFRAAAPPTIPGAMPATPSAGAPADRSPGGDAAQDAPVNARVNQNPKPFIASSWGRWPRLPNPPDPPWLEPTMSQILLLALLTVAWVILQRWILPRLGVPT